VREAFKAAYSCLDGIYRGKTYSQVVLTETIEQFGNSPLIAKIVYGVLDRDIELSYIVGKFASSVKPAVMPVLKIGAYCIKYLALPDHTVVNECVELTKAIGKAGVSGFVNAVLKNISQAVQSNSVFWSKNELENISLKNSFPLWALKILVSDYGKETAVKFAEYFPENSFTHVRVNLAKTTIEKLRALLKENNIEFRPSPLPDGFFVTGNLAGLKSGNAAKTQKTISGGTPDNAKSLQSWYTAQSAASMIVCKAVNVKDGQTVLDVCAAPGGKSVYLASLAERVKVTACDIHEHRVELIRKYAHRMGVQIKAIKQDATETNEEFVNKFDKVLCDVPCSGFGVLGSKPDIKLFRKENDLTELAELQAKILERSARYVKVGGSLIYSTCTIFKKENDEVVMEFLKKHDNFTIEKVDTGFDGVINENGFVQFLPYRDKIDGFFIAKIKRLK